MGLYSEYRGSVNGTVQMPRSESALPFLIKNFALVPVSGSVAASVYLIRGEQEIRLMPSNYNITLGQMYQSERETVLLASETVKIVTSGDTDYDFLFENLTP